jgi:hypothetical protein
MSNPLANRGVVLIAHHYTVVRDGAEVVLSPMQFRMLEMIATSEIGMTPEALFDRLYAGMDTPLHGRRSIHIQRVNANHKLEPLRVRITSNRRHGGPGSVYRVIAA